MSGVLQAQASNCQRTFSTAAALTATCSDATSPLSPTYWAGLEFPPKPSATQLSPATVKALARRDLETGAWAQLDPQTDVQAPTAAVGPPVTCSGVRKRLGCVSGWAVSIVWGGCSYRCPAVDGAREHTQEQHALHPATITKHGLQLVPMHRLAIGQPKAYSQKKQQSTVKISMYGHHTHAIAAVDGSFPCFSNNARGSANHLVD